MPMTDDEKLSRAIALLNEASELLRETVGKRSPSADSNRSLHDQLPEIATRPQVAAYLQLSSSTLARWAVEGKGPKLTKIGGSARYRRSDVLAYAASL